MEAIDGRFTGEIGVAMAVERLLRAGYHVAKPVVDDGYDLLAFDRRRYWRIQVKASAGRDKRDHYRIRLTRGRTNRTRYEPRHVDAFILVNTTTNVVACVPVSATKRHRWFQWSHARRWADMGAIRRIKTQRC